ncbi:MAG: hypothetical protein K6A65_01875 [Succinivibrionaceae bacterium]|nr:hypothetical protein [Succinivibrionaceae bacterium]
MRGLKYLTTAAALCLAAGCASPTAPSGSSGASGHADGTYHGISEPDERGGYGVATITYRGNRIVACDFMTYNDRGEPKGEDYGKVGGEITDQAYYEMAQASVRARAEYSRELLERQDPAAVDAISGATSAHAQFVGAVRNAQESALLK